MRTRIETKVDLRMKPRIWLISLLVLVLLLAGCQEEVVTKPDDIEPTATYDWMAGESPVPNKRMGLLRAGLTTGLQTVSPNGIYFVVKTDDLRNSYILYADHGSDTFIKLCGRSDCSHSSPDCNAYVYNGAKLTYYGGYLYVVSGDAYGDRLIRMDPDGGNHLTVMEFQEFAHEHGADLAQCELITNGICKFSLYNGKNVDGQYELEYLETYMFKLDGSMSEPRAGKSGASVWYSCGDVFYATSDSIHGNDGRSVFDWDPETNTLTYLTEHPGTAGYFGENEAYYFKDGAVRRLTYATQTEEAVIDTDLEGDYYVYCFPECLVLASREMGKETDNSLYIYNWAFELVDTVTIANPMSVRTNSMLIGETAERFILSNTYDGLPLYYINKSELGSGNVKTHKFTLPDM